MMQRALWCCTCPGHCSRGGAARLSHSPGHCSTAPCAAAGEAQHGAVTARGAAARRRALQPGRHSAARRRALQSGRHSAARRRALQHHTNPTPRCGHNAALATAPYKHPKGRPPHRDTGNGPSSERANHGSCRGPRGPKTAGTGHFRAPNRLKSMGHPAGLKQNAIARCWPCGC